MCDYCHKKIELESYKDERKEFSLSIDPKFADLDFEFKHSDEDKPCKYGVTEQRFVFCPMCGKRYIRPIIEHYVPAGNDFVKYNLWKIFEPFRKDNEDVDWKIRDEVRVMLSNFYKFRAACPPKDYEEKDIQDSELFNKIQDYLIDKLRNPFSDLK